ncbi:WXG100 family type VII secretion target [Streptomyces sp. 549]|uniref:WXG100 family type VII secretion target n=1 Tax=Streptomyces sp. 549 TaxID=3049076 RepID=UPI0024C3685E|nr:WXG100 family type VII secretion target [Streptomyces sp. 549]MDK1476953.1 WXG100 family type VII secretion target [Streptomyces sp. 549]
MAEGNSGASFKSEEQNLRDLIREVEEMQTTLQGRIGKLNAAVDAIEGGWKGSAHGAYDHLQRNANEYARKLQNRLRFIKEALEMSKDGFNANEIEQMENFKKTAGQSPISDFVAPSPSVK